MQTYTCTHTSRHNRHKETLLYFSSTVLCRLPLTPNNRTAALTVCTRAHVWKRTQAMPRRKSVWHICLINSTGCVHETLSEISGKVFTFLPGKCPVYRRYAPFSGIVNLKYIQKLHHFRLGVELQLSHMQKRRQLHHHAALITIAQSDSSSSLRSPEGGEVVNKRRWRRLKSLGNRLVTKAWDNAPCIRNSTESFHF